MSVFQMTYKHNGKKKTSRVWRIEFRDHTGVRRRVSGYRDKNGSEQLERIIGQLVACRCSGLLPEGDLARAVEMMRANVRNRLVEWGVLDKRRQHAAKPAKRARNRHGRAVSAGTRYDVLCRDSVCQICGIGPRDARLVVDHVMPLARGGTNEPWNLWALCADCNAAKHAKVPPPEHLEIAAARHKVWKAAERARLAAAVAKLPALDARVEVFVLAKSAGIGVREVAALNRTVHYEPGKGLVSTNPKAPYSKV